MTWLSFCARRPGPEWKTGYTGVPFRTLREIEGVVDHSMEGYMAGAYSVLDGPRQSSWTFSLPKYSEPIQHYSLEKITWHAGLPGDRKQDTSLIGNLTLGGKEHEGKKGEPWTENQVFWSAKIDVALRQLCPAFGANPPTMRLNIFWHTWLSATSCPSERNPDEAKIALINEWENQPIEEEEDMPKFIQLKGSLAIAIIDGNTKLQVRQELLSALYGPNLNVLEVSQADWDSIPDAHGGGSGAYTDKQAVEAVKDKLT